MPEIFGPGRRHHRWTGVLRGSGRLESGCWDMARIESPLIGSGSQEEVDLRVQALLDLGTSRGYLTYEELNERLPDEVVSPDKLDSLLMMIDEMGIKLIDETDAPEHQQKVDRADQDSKSWKRSARKSKS